MIFLFHKLGLPILACSAEHRSVPLRDESTVTPHTREVTEGTSKKAPITPGALWARHQRMFGKAPSLFAFYLALFSIFIRRLFGFALGFARLLLLDGAQLSVVFR